MHLVATFLCPLTLYLPPSWVCINFPLNRQYFQPMRNALNRILKFFINTPICACNCDQKERWQNSTVKIPQMRRSSCMFSLQYLHLQFISLQVVRLLAKLFTQNSSTWPALNAESNCPCSSEVRNTRRPFPLVSSSWLSADAIRVVHNFEGFLDKFNLTFSKIIHRVTLHKKKNRH